MKILPLCLAAPAILIFGTSCNSMQSSLASKSSSAASGVKAKRVVRSTAYSCKENEAGGKYGSNSACGTRLLYGQVRSAAADWSRYPVGTKFRIAGQPHIYIVDDYGSALVGTGTIDFYKPNLRMMREWGVRHVEIEILQWGSFQRSAEILKARTHYSHIRKMYRNITPKLGNVAASPAVGSNAQG
jgi:3D (Asp-Asp-Asp) domain-containing protein